MDSSLLGHDVRHAVQTGAAVLCYTFAGTLVVFLVVIAVHSAMYGVAPAPGAADENTDPTTYRRGRRNSEHTAEFEDVEQDASQLSTPGQASRTASQTAQENSVSDTPSSGTGRRKQFRIFSNQQQMH
mmetsp:Transcript_8002/g.21994  ORF Transcript_8002/g.21994 Transcript_8002/m.21994 type:complete len:128 (-) Transcript_8002:686-1069(-)